MDFLKPWDASSDIRHLQELRREMAPGHILEGIAVSPIAYRNDRDEVTFAMDDGSGRWAIVHFGLPKEREKDPRFPATWIFENWETVNEYMEAAHAAWTGAEKDPDGQFWLKEQQMLSTARKF